MSNTRRLEPINPTYHDKDWGEVSWTIKSKIIRSF